MKPVFILKILFWLFLKEQDRYAWKLAQGQYRKKTKGRDLQKDLEKYGLNDQIMDALSQRWDIFNKKNRDRYIHLYQDGVNRYRGGNE